MSEKSISFSQNSPVKETNLFVHLKFSDFLIVLGSSPRLFILGKDSPANKEASHPLQKGKQASPDRVGL